MFKGLSRQAGFCACSSSLFSSSFTPLLHQQRHQNVETCHMSTTTSRNVFFFFIGSHRNPVMFLCNCYAIDTCMVDCAKRCNPVPCSIRAGDEKRVQYTSETNWKIDWSYGTFFRHYVTKLLPCSKYTCLLCQHRRRSHQMTSSLFLCMIIAVYI